MERKRSSGFYRIFTVNVNLNDWPEGLEPPTQRLDIGERRKNTTKPATSFSFHDSVRYCYKILFRFPIYTCIKETESLSAASITKILAYR